MKKKMKAIRVYQKGRDIPYLTFYTNSDEMVEKIKNQYTSYDIKIRKEGELIPPKYDKSNERYKGCLKFNDKNI